MGYDVTFKLDPFGTDDPVKERLAHRSLQHMLRALTAIQVDYLRAYPKTPRLYDLFKQGIVKYEVEPPGREWWQDIPTSIRLGTLDCEDAASWRCAELRVFDNVAAECAVSLTRLPGGGSLFHILVKHPTIETAGRFNPMFHTNVSGGGNPLIEDPSRIIGMR